MLDADIKQQLEQYLKLLEGDVLLKVSAVPIKYLKT